MYYLKKGEIILNNVNHQTTKELIDLNKLPVRLSIRAAANVAGMSMWTIKKYVQLKKIPSIHKGRRVYVKTRTFLEWLDKDEPNITTGKDKMSRNLAGRFKSCTK